MSNTTKYKVLYTKHKTQKKKKYEDGYAIVNSANKKISLYCEKNALLDSKFFRDIDFSDMKDQNLEFDRYLVDFGEAELAEPTKATSTPVQTPKPPPPKLNIAPRTTSSNTSTSASSTTSTTTSAPKKKFVPPFAARPKQEDIPSSEDNNEDDETYTAPPTIRHQPAPSTVKPPPRAKPTPSLPPKQAAVSRVNSTLQRKAPAPARPYELMEAPKYNLFDGEEDDAEVLPSADPFQDTEDTSGQDNSDSQSSVTSNTEPAVSTTTKKQQAANPTKQPQQKPVIPKKPLVKPSSNVVHELINDVKIPLFGDDDDDDEREMEEEEEAIPVKKKQAPTAPKKQVSTNDFVPAKKVVTQTVETKASPAAVTKPAASSSAATPTRAFTPPKSVTSTTGAGERSMLHTTSVLQIVKKISGETHSLCFPDIAACEIYMDKGVMPPRSVKIPNTFQSVRAYVTTYLDAVYEEMNIQLFEKAIQFRKTYFRITKSAEVSAPPQKGSICPQHGAAELKFSNKRQQYFYICTKGKEKCKHFAWVDAKGASMFKQCTNPITDPVERKKFFRKNGVPYYVDCELVQVMNPNTNESYQWRKNNANWFLKLSDKEFGSVYSTDDLWIISPSEDFNPKKGNIVLCRSVFHGPSSNYSLQVKVVAGKPNYKKNEPLYAIRGPNFSNEFAMIEALESIEGQKNPLLVDLLATDEKNRSRLLTGRQAVADFNIGLSKEEIEEVLEGFISKYQLNSDQREVLSAAAKWFEDGDSSSPITLVHGVFGAGKSFMLVVLIMFICAVLEQAKNEDIKILISALTNVAVDNILLGLLKLGFTEFIRVGSQKKIAKSILPYSVSATESSQKELLRELEDMMREEMDEEEKKSVQKAIDDVESGAMEKRRSSIKDVRVVGITCAATSFEVMKGTVFPILILDEASQCLEPQALIPISKFDCQKVIAVGDPQQLPPTLSSAPCADIANSIEKTLFIRLANTALKPIMLRTQYRCHPWISHLSNKLFYSNRLLDGITPDDRSPLVENLAPVTIIDSTSGKEEFHFGSFKNTHEAEVISHMIKLLSDIGVEQDQMGVISLYRAQTDCIRESLKQEGFKAVKVSTVDAFQGGERDVIFLSTVRTTQSQGFVESSRRINVALTRAKRHLVVVCKQSVFAQTTLWQDVIKHSLSMNSVYLSSRVLTSQNFDFLQSVRAPKIAAPPPVAAPKKVLLDDDEEEAIPVRSSKPVPEQQVNKPSPKRGREDEEEVEEEPIPKKQRLAPVVDAPPFQEEDDDLEIDIDALEQQYYETKQKQAVEEKNEEEKEHKEQEPKESPTEEEHNIGESSKQQEQVIEEEMPQTLSGFDIPEANSSKSSLPPPPPSLDDVPDHYTSHDISLAEDDEVAMAVGKKSSGDELVNEEAEDEFAF